MKKLKLFFACLLMAVLSIGQVWGAAISVTTNPTTSGTFTITAAKASGQNAPIEASGCVRLYAKNTLTIETSGDANITGMTIAWTKNGSKAFATVTTETGSYTHPSAAGNGTWTGSAKEIVFNVGSSGQIQITSVDITVEEGGGSSKDDLTDEQLSWSAASANITFGDEPYSLPSLTNSIPVSVTYESTAEAVATISNVGVVSVLKAGSTTIKAIFAGNDDYNAKTVLYTLTVAPAPLTPIAGGIVDEIKISDLLTSGSGYQPFSDKQASNEGHSDAVYAGKVCISSTNIQMNTIGTNTSAGRGIATTTSGGNAKRVQAFWGGSNTADRKLTVYGSNTAYAGTETAASGTKLGDLTYASGDSYAYIDITGDYAYLQIVASGAIFMSQINITWVAPDVSKVATPAISGTDNFFSTSEISISCSTDDATIYYTTDGNDPTTSSTAYTAPFSVNATTTVKAIAVKDGMTNSDIANATFTKATVLTVAEARTAIDAGGDLTNKYVAGIISQIDSYNSTYHSITYWISDDGTTTDQLQVYSGLAGIVKAEFTSVEDLNVGDDVTVNGTLKKYSSTYEFDKNNEIVARKPIARLAWSGTTEGAYAASLEGGNTFPTLTNSDGVSVSYSSSETSYASFSDASDYSTLTLNAVGSTTITANFAGNPSFKANSVSYTLNVSSSVIKADISFECNGAVSCPDGILAASNLPSPLPTVTKAGKNFGGWFTDSEFNTPAVAGDAVTSTDPITLYAKWLEPYTVAEALAIIDALADNGTIEGQYVSGVISQVDSYNNTYHSITYWISADGTTTSQLEVYSGLIGNAATPLGKEAFDAADNLQVGDEVVVFGTLKKYVKNETTTPEFDKNNTIYSFNRPAVAVTGIDLTESTAEVEVGSTVTLHASVVPGNATDQGIVWSVTSGSDKASVDENGVVTGTAAGEAVIRAASHEDASIYEECTVTVTAVDPTKHVVTFDATLDYGDSPLVKGDITMTCTSGALNNQSEYRLYKSSTTTFACSVGNITKIEFTGVSGNPVSGFGDPEVGTLVTEGNNGVWTGNAESVSFVASGAQVRATEIVVTYKEDNRAAAGLTWSTDAVELTVGDEFTAPTLNNPNSIAAGEITIASDNTDLAIVTAGVVSLVADATGTATITATFEGNEDYKPAVVSYTITVNEAGLDNVTFDSSEDHAESGETTITKGGFTLSFTSGSMDGTQAEYRLYKSQTMTLSSTDYLIKKIEFTCTSGNPITGFADATGLDKDNNEWTGESNTVELTASNAQVRMTKIKVFYVEDTRAAAGLAWNPAEDITLTVGDELTAPALLNPNSIDAAEITIESSNTDLATVSEGVVSLVADATGTTTITATFAGNDDFKPATVSYKITVNPAHSIYVSPSLNVNFGNVDKDAEVADKTITVTLTGVDAATLTLAGDGASAFTISPAAALTASGDITISASSANLGTFAATLTISDDASQAESKVVHLSLTVNEVVVPETPVSTTSEWVAATEIADGMQVLIVGVNNTDYYAMGAQSGTGGTGNNRVAVAASVDGEGVLTPGENTMSFTLVAQGDGTYAIKTSNNKYLYAAASGSNHLKTQDEVDVNAKWTLTVASAVAEGSSNRNVMQFNSGSSIFSCYASASQKSIAFYVPKPVTPPTADYTRPGLTVGNYATICLPNGGTISGATLFDLDYYDGANTLYLLEVNGNAMVAGRPYVFLPSATTIEVFYTDNANASAGSYRGLVGSYSEHAITVDDGNYILWKNAYYFVDSQARVGANRAYIHMADVPTEPTQQSSGAPRRRVAMTVNGKDAAQGFENLDASEKPLKVMIDGTMYILRGEKVYDATGRLVK